MSDKKDKLNSKAKAKKSSETLTQPPVQGKDYYLENGLMVFTEAFHLKRGYCCGSGCRHCPYPKK